MRRIGTYKLCSDMENAGGGNGENKVFSPFSAPAPCENGRREAVWGPGSPERRDPLARTPRARRKHQRVPRLRNGGARPGFVLPLSSGLKKNLKMWHSESAKQSRLHVAHGRALWGTLRLSVSGRDNMERTRSTSARRRGGDRANSNFSFFPGLATLTSGFN